MLGIFCTTFQDSWNVFRSDLWTERTAVPSGILGIPAPFFLTAVYKCLVMECQGMLGL